MFVSLYLRTGATRLLRSHCGCKTVGFNLSRNMTVGGSHSNDKSLNDHSLTTSTAASTSLHFLPGFPEEWRQKFLNSFKVVNNFVSEEEETSIMKEVEPHLKRMMYEKDHWDEAIAGFRETERRHWNSTNSAVLDRVRSAAFAPQLELLPYAHVLDLSSDGHIKPHVDSARFCGDVVAVLSLLSDAVARFSLDKDRDGVKVDLLLPRRSLYIMSGESRYDFAHEILPNGDQSTDFTVERGRRVSVICRCQPDSDRAAKS